MPQIFESRMQADHHDEIVVFLIGAFVRRWWKPHRWLPVAAAMPRMLAELADHPELGYLGGESYFGRTSLMVQYWRSREDLYNYARNRDAEHLPAWRNFNRRIGKSGDVGVYHETYAVPKTGIDTLYVNMPAFGLGRVVGLREARHPKRKPAASQGAAAPALIPQTRASVAGTRPQAA